MIAAQRRVMSTAVIAAVVTLALMCTARTDAQPTMEACDAYINSTAITGPFSVIFTADPGTFSGTAEDRYLVANLKQNTSKSRDETVCGSIETGLLMGQPVAVITTGIGPTAAGVCALEVLSNCGPYMKEALYFGTSGWSSQLGGVVNPPDCSSANSNGQIVRLGDVCISPFSVNWVCKKASWLQQADGYPNECFRPAETNSPNASFLYGQCEFWETNLEANLKLADELLAVATSQMGLGNFPQRSDKAAETDAKYWSMMANATKIEYPTPNAGTPKVWNYTQCTEVDGQFFYSGAPFELKGRDYVAEVMSLALNMTLTAKDVIAVSAMEAVGVTDAIDKYNKLRTTSKQVPFTNIRAASNWLHQPLVQTETGVWRTGEELPEDFATGYGYAIASGSAAIMSMFQARCEAAVAAQQLDAGTDCTFTINYS